MSTASGTLRPLLIIATPVTSAHAEMPNEGATISLAPCRNSSPGLTFPPTSALALLDRTWCCERGRGAVANGNEGAATDVRSHGTFSLSAVVLLYLHFPLGGLYMRLTIVAAALAGLALSGAAPAQQQTKPAALPPDVH